MTFHRISDMAEDDRPRERLQALGARALSNAELLAILLRVGIKGESAVQLASRILRECGGLGGLASTSVSQLASIKGIGLAKASQILAALELGNRVARAQLGTRPVIGSPEDAAVIFQGLLQGKEQEGVVLLLLDIKNRVIDTVELYQGTLNTSNIRIAEVFREAIRKNAASIIMAHNHPTGDPTPSPEDIAVTRSIAQAGQQLELPLLDHLVIGQASFISLKKAGFFTR
ncbi:MAG TPA: DNA repair protein RadC [Anaerolineales bacterium]|nr:DNA repair protein RadC [Anaerolineales bacterium]